MLFEGLSVHGVVIRAEFSAVPELCTYDNKGVAANVFLTRISTADVTVCDLTGAPSDGECRGRARCRLGG